MSENTQALATELTEKNLPGYTNEPYADLAEHQSQLSNDWQIAEILEDIPTPNLDKRILGWEAALSNHAF